MQTSFCLSGRDDVCIFIFIVIYHSNTEGAQVDNFRKQIKHLLRGAKIIHRQYGSGMAARQPVYFADGPDQQLSQLQSRLNLAASKGWWRAHERIRREYRYQLRRMREQLDLVIRQNDAQPDLGLGESDILRDLIALQTEFGSVAVNLKSKFVTVVTESIEFDGICFGSFKIRLDVETLSDATKARYEVLALDPNPAASDEDVTHPHVHANRLCEGDAQPAIRLALCQGRLFDFFQLVNNVLTTYNAASAYVSLADWGDLTCVDCGSLSSGDYCEPCSSCDSRVCDSCWCTCTGCDEHHCGDCSFTCSGCQDDVCKSCGRKCEGCDENFCPKCLKEDERCNRCDQQTNEDEGGDELSPEDSHAEVHSDGLGQAAVPA
jgi:hypothetical protein